VAVRPEIDGGAGALRQQPLFLTPLQKEIDKKKREGKGGGSPLHGGGCKGIYERECLYPLLER